MLFGVVLDICQFVLPEETSQYFKKGIIFLWRGSGEKGGKERKDKEILSKTPVF